MCQEKTDFADAILSASGKTQVADPLKQQRLENRSAANAAKQRGVQFVQRLGEAYLRQTNYFQKYNEVSALLNAVKPGDANYNHKALMGKFDELKVEGDKLQVVADNLEKEWDTWINDILVQLSGFQTKVESSIRDYTKRQEFTTTFQGQIDTLNNAISVEGPKGLGLRNRIPIQKAFDDAMAALRKQMQGGSAEAPKTPDFEVSTTGDPMDNFDTSESEVVEFLINKFSVTSVTTKEAKTRKDYIVTYKKDTRRRIDRQGPAYNDTHAKFAVQLGSATVAGVEMECGFDFDAAFVKKAFRDSLQQGRYIRIFAR
jgi:hypothetical protein